MSSDEPARKQRPKFPPFQGPNYTMVPDAVFDHLLTELTGAELKVLLYIIRRTFGFKRDSDNISLSQMLHGITTREGKVLDRGVGLSKASLLAALRALQEMNLLLTQRRQSAERGNEPTSYQLNVVGNPLGLESRPPLVKKVDQGVGQESSPSPWSKNLTTQETVLQETEGQQHSSVVVVAHLTEFGITRGTAEQLAASYPQDYLLAKLDFVRYLVENKSPLVAKNPAGYLRRAIEEDYAPPPRYKTPAQREAAELRRREVESAQQATRRLAEETWRRAKELAGDAMRQHYPPQPIPRTEHTTETAWKQTLHQLEQQMTAANYQTWLKDTVLVSCNGSEALIVAPNSFVREWLATRFTRLIDRQLQDVLGYPVTSQYLAATEISAAPEAGQQALSTPTTLFEHSP